MSQHANTAHNRIRDALAAHQRDETSGYRYTPLTVRLDLATPIALTRPEDLALDGLLADALLKRLLGDDFYALPGPRESPLFVRLPLATQGPDAAAKVDRWRSGFWPDVARDLDGVWWWYAASTARLVDVAARGSDYWVKRFDTRAELSDHLEFGGRAAKVDVSGGRYKAYHQPLPVITCRAVEWDVMGDGAAIAALLADIAFVGKKAAYGYGEVRGVHVTPAERDGSLVCADGVTWTRPVPLAALDRMDGGYELAAHTARAYIAYRAPQWLPYNQTLCAVAHAASEQTA